TMDRIVTQLKLIPLNTFRASIQTLTHNIVQFVIDKKIVDSKYHTCVRDFMLVTHEKTWTGDQILNPCEDILMMQLRDESFVELIIRYVNKLSKQKHWIIVTLGTLHCDSIRSLLEARGFKVRIVHTG